MQSDCAGRDDNLLTAAQCRDEIGERLADAGAGFDDRVHAFEKAALDQLRHLHLTGTRLEAGEDARKRSIRSKDGVDRFDHLRVGGWRRLIL